MAVRGGHEQCPRRARWRGIDFDSGQFYNLSCGANTCAYCIETNVWSWGMAFAQACPTRYAVLTGLSGEWEQDRLKIKSFHRNLDRHGFDVRSAYSIEENPRGTGFHLNLWWHAGDTSEDLAKAGYVPQQHLSGLAEDMGWRVVADVRRWRQVSSERGQYGMKEAQASQYGMKEARGAPGEALAVSDRLSPRQAAYLARNGMRLMHARPTFWRDGPAGEALGSRRETLRAWWKAQGCAERRREAWAVYAGLQVLASSSHPVVAPA